MPKAPGTTEKKKRKHLWFGPIVQSLKDMLIEMAQVNGPALLRKGKGPWVDMLRVWDTNASLEQSHLHCEARAAASPCLPDPWTFVRGTITPNLLFSSWSPCTYNQKHSHFSCRQADTVSHAAACHHHQQEQQPEAIRTPFSGTWIGTNTSVSSSHSSLELRKPEIQRIPLTQSRNQSPELGEIRWVSCVPTDVHQL